MTRFQFVPIIFLAALLTGCGTFHVPPPANSQQRIATVPATQRTNECQIFVVTDRDAEPNREPHIFFQNTASYLIKGASGTVKIDRYAKTPEDLWKRSVEDEGISPLLLDLDPLGILWSVVPKPNATTNPAESSEAHHFCSLIDQRLAETGADDIVIFVHGYNTTIEGNASILAALWHYSGRKFVPIAFEWPSDVKLIAYTIDKQNAARSTRTFRLLLEMLAEQTHAKRIHILAHSAGTAVAVNALHELRLSSSMLNHDELREKYRIGSVVLAAPDLDTVEYLNMAMDGVLDVSRRLTIYMSSDDHALILAHWLFGDDRLGLIGQDRAYSDESRWLASLGHSDAINVAPALKHYPSDWFGHSYYYRNPIVSQDVIRALLTTDPPRARGIRPDPDLPGILALPEDPPPATMPTTDATAVK